MKRILFSTLLLLCCVSFTHAQRFQRTTGGTPAEETWAVIEDAALGRHVTIGNSTNSDGGRVWICSYTPSGQFITSAIMSNGRKMIARDICLAPPDPNSPNFPRTYYITGWTLGSNNLSQMFVARINLSGQVLWYMESPPSTSVGNNEEGVAIAMAPNGDAVAAGHVSMPSVGGVAAGQRVKLARFTSAGAVLWSNTYNCEGNWKVREIANATGNTACASPTTTPGEFIITGEMNFPTSSGGQGTNRTFAAYYKGDGTECWRNMYPAPVPGTVSNIIGDGGYDVVQRSGGNFVIAGAVRYGPNRAQATPYFVEVTPAGAFVNAAIYTKKDSTALGIYPRCVSIGQTSVQLVCAGPDFGNNNTFFMRITSIGSAAVIERYPGTTTANAVAQPFYLDEGPMEGILYTTMGTSVGYVISTTRIPGVFGNSDAHMIKSDVFGRTPAACANVDVVSVSRTAGSMQQFSSTPFQTSWQQGQGSNQSYGLGQTLCKDSCYATSSYTYTQNGAAVSFSGSGAGSGTISYSWEFGDGSSSSLQNPSHTYAASGTYNACLTVRNVDAYGDTCKSSTCKQIVVQVCNVHASFTDSMACKKVYYTNTSTGSGTLTYNWLFDDGTTSTDANPSHQYATCGQHVTRLIACNSNCCDTFYKTTTIPCCEVKSDFCIRDSGRFVKVDIVTGRVPLPGTTYTIYVDGVVKQGMDTAYKELTPGLHTICVKAQRSTCPGDTCCSTCCKTISISNPCTLLSDFWITNQTSGTVQFTNKTAVPSGVNVTYKWEFGDGLTSTSTSPVHGYTTAGTFMVCLTSQIVSGTDTCRSRVCRKVIVEGQCKPLANFMTTHCISTPTTVVFKNLSTGGGAYSWSFGDGTTSTATSPTKTYASIGSYIVCLTQTVGDCWSKTCYRVVVSTASCDTSCNQMPPPPIFSNPSRQVNNPMTLEGSVKSENGMVQDNTETLRKMNDELTNDKVSLFPNPASEKVQLIVESKLTRNAEVTVINSLGSVVYRKSVAINEGKNQYSIPLQALSTGNYFLKLNTWDKMQTTMFSVKK